jgi:hypothetical protein
VLDVFERHSWCGVLDVSGVGASLPGTRMKWLYELMIDSEFYNPDEFAL